MNGRQATIIGVGPKDFLGIFPSTPAELFLPVTADPAVAPELADDILHRTTQPAFRVLVRLRPGMTMAATEARLDAHTRELDRQTAKRGSRTERTPGTPAVGGSGVAAAYSRSDLWW